MEARVAKAPAGDSVAMHLKDPVRLKGEVAMHLKDAKQLYYRKRR
jgi:hypothetical protein